MTQAQQTDLASLIERVHEQVVAVLGEHYQPAMSQGIRFDLAEGFPKSGKHNQAVSEVLPAVLQTLGPRFKLRNLWSIINFLQSMTISSRDTPIIFAALPVVLAALGERFDYRALPQIGVGLRTIAEVNRAHQTAAFARLPEEIEKLGNGFIPKDLSGIAVSLDDALKATSGSALLREELDRAGNAATEPQNAP